MNGGTETWRRAIRESAVVLALGCLAPTSHAESLSEVVRHALDTHPAMQAASSASAASELQLQVSRAVRWPQLGLVADPGRGGVSRASGSEVGDVALRASLLLYDGGRSRESIGRDESRARAAMADLRLSSEELAGRIADVYIELYRQERLASIARENFQAHQALYDRVREIASFDRGRASDLLQAGARLEQAGLSLAAREGAVAELRAVLAGIAGLDVHAVELPEEPLSAETVTLAAAVGALDQHPAVMAADAEAEAAERSARLASGWVHPRIDLLATAESPVEAGAGRRYFDDLSVRVAATWAPVDGGAGRAAARVADRHSDQARAAAQAIRRELSARIAGLWTQLGARQARVRSQQVLVARTQDVREAYWQQFTIGRRSIIDLLNAEGEHFQARTSAEDERVGLLQARYRLLAAEARLTTWLGVVQAAEQRP